MNKAVLLPYISLASIGIEKEQKSHLFSTKHKTKTWNKNQQLKCNIVSGKFDVGSECCGLTDIQWIALLNRDWEDL